MLCLVAQSCLTLCHPWTGACQVPLSMKILQAKILEWVAKPYSRGSSWPRNQTGVSCMAGRFFTRAAQWNYITKINHMADIITMAPHSSTLAWKIPWAEEPGGLPSTGSNRVRQDWSDLATAADIIKDNHGKKHEDKKALRDGLNNRGRSLIRWVRENNLGADPRDLQSEGVWKGATGMAVDI